MWTALLAVATLLEVPFVEQQKDTCAAAALSMVMTYWHQPVAQADVARALLQKDLHGILGSRLTEFAQARGFQAIAFAGDLGLLRDYVAKGRPLIATWKVGRDRYHDVVVVGFDADRKRILVNDPAVGAAREVSERDFEKRWAGADHWTLLVLPAASPSPAPVPDGPPSQ
jgi:ABC-type bacteriocin/lantibiotic exporter with double-glycine peptidase domain